MTSRTIHSGRLRDCLKAWITSRRLIAFARFWLSLPPFSVTSKETFSKSLSKSTSLSKRLTASAPSPNSAPVYLEMNLAVDKKSNGSCKSGSFSSIDLAFS